MASSLVVLLLAVGYALSTFVVQAVALVLGGFRKDRPWQEKARALTPMRAVSLVTQLALPTMAVLALSDLATSMGSRLGIAFAALLGWYAATHAIGAIVARAHVFPKQTVRFEGARQVGVTSLIWTAVLLPLLALGLDHSTRLLACGISIAVAVVRLFWGVEIFGFFGLTEPLPEALSRYISARDPRVKTVALRLLVANAYALPLRRTVLFTTGALQVVSPQGLEALAEHELAHLREGFWMNLLRTAPHLIFVGTIVVMALAPDGKALLWGSAGYLGGYVLWLTVLRVSRRKEAAADQAALQHTSNPQVYAEALFDLHRASLLPAVVAGSTHPSLYDRMLAAGLSPDFPRPKPPSALGSILAVACSMLIAATWTTWVATRYAVP